MTIKFGQGNKSMRFLSISQILDANRAALLQVANWFDKWKAADLTTRRSRHIAVTHRTNIVSLYLKTVTKFGQHVD